jgi:hypothetical protein
MSKSRVILAALALLAATPVMAQEMGGGSMGAEPSYGSGYYGYNDGYYGGSRPGIWPGAVAAGVAGSAAATADGIVTVPLRGAYAYDCRHGTWFHDEQGRRRLCR